MGTLRQLEVTPASGVAFAVTAAGMGQNLFAPPNVKGWPGGESWINSNTLLARKQFLDRLARMDEAPGAMITVASTPREAKIEAMAPATTTSAMATTATTVPSPSAGTDTTAPRAAPGVTDADQLRAQRFARQVDRGVRNVRFDAAAWIARRDGPSGVAKRQSAHALLLPLPPFAAEAPAFGNDPLAFVRATLLDPAYQLK